MLLSEDEPLEVRQDNVKSWLAGIDEDALEATIPYDLYEDYVWDKMFTKTGEDYVRYRDFEDVLLERDDLILYLFDPLTGYDDIPRLYHDSPAALPYINEGAVISNDKAYGRNITGVHLNNFSPEVQAFFHVEHITPTGMRSFSARDRQETPCADKTRLIDRSVNYIYTRFKYYCDNYFDLWHSDFTAPEFIDQVKRMFDIETEVKVLKGTVRIGDDGKYSKSWEENTMVFVERSEKQTDPDKERKAIA